MMQKCWLRSSILISFAIGQLSLCMSFAHKDINLQEFHVIEKHVSGSRDRDKPQAVRLTR